MLRRRGDDRGLVTLLFTDIVGSSDVASELGDERWHRLQARHHDVVRKQFKRFGGHEVDTAGDGFFITFSSPTRGVRCASAIVREVRELGLDVRAGVHIGEAQLTGEKVGGIAVTIASRVGALAGAGEVLVTATIENFNRLGIFSHLLKLILHFCFSTARPAVQNNALARFQRRIYFRFQNRSCHGVCLRKLICSISPRQSVAL